MYRLEMTGNNPRGGGSGRTIPDGTLECTEDQLLEFYEKGAFLPGTKEFRFTYDGTDLVEVSDARPTGTWSDDSGKAEVVDGNLVFRLKVGEVAPQVTLTTSVAADVVDFAFNTTTYVRMDFARGTTASLTIDTDKPCEYTVVKCDKFALENTLTVRVSSETMYAARR